MKKTPSQEPIIIIDTREQKPWIFPEVKTVVQKLNSGDYSLVEPAGKICIERKSLDDYVHTVIHGRERFKKELARLKEEYEIAAIIVEGDLSDVRKHYYTSQAHPNSIMGSATAIIIEYKIGVFFASNAKDAAWMAQSMLLRTWKNFQEEMKLGEEQSHD